MFNKKDEERKTKRETQDKLRNVVKDQNKEIEDNDINLDKERRKLDDRDLKKKQQTITAQLRQESNKVNIDISIAESRIKDLEGLKDMTYMQIKDILQDKRKVDKQNQEFEVKIQKESKGIGTDGESKEKQQDAEREQIKKVSNSLKFQKEQATSLMDRLKEEETKGKDMLDEKIKIQQELSQLQEDLAEAKQML